MQKLFREVSKLKVYNDNEIKEMIQSYQKGDEKIISKIIESNMKVIIFYANQFKNNIKEIQIIELSDLINEGVIGLEKAVKKYNYTKNDNFTYYASLWIKRSICDFINQNKQAIKIPTNKLTTNYQIGKEIEKLAEVNDFEIEKLNKFTKKAIDFYFNKISFDPIINEIAEVENENFEDEDEIKNKITVVLKFLKPKQNKIIKMLYGIDEQIKTPKEISKLLNISCANISYTRTKALNEMKKIIINSNNNNN